MKTLTFNKLKDMSLTEIKDPPEIIKMLSLDLLKVGQHFTKEQVEMILDCKYVDGWSFLGRYIRLKSLLEVRGFFITQAGLEEGEFRILEDEEMAHYGYKNLCKAMAITSRTSYVLARHDYSKLGDKDKKIYENVRNKAASMAISQQNILFSDHIL